MNFTVRLIAASVLAGVAAAASAVEAEQSSTWTTASTKNWADTRAETQAALRAGTLQSNEYAYTVLPGAGSALTRAQVTAEAREALRLGLIPVHEGQYRFATAAENEQIRQAGLRALNTDRQLAGK